MSADTPVNSQIEDDEYHDLLPRPPALGEEKKDISETTSQQTPIEERPTKLCGDSNATSVSDQGENYDEPDSNNFSKNEFKRQLMMSDEKLKKLNINDDDRTTAPYLKWALELKYLLLNTVGVSLFKTYLASEGKQHVDALEFWFAVEGLHDQKTPDTIAQLVKVIYRHYFMKSQLPIDEKMKMEVHRKYKQFGAHELGNLFDAAKEHVECIMRQTTYPNFLRSDIYLQYLQSQQNKSIDKYNHLDGNEIDSENEIIYHPSAATALPTLHEDAILNNDQLNNGQRKPVPPRLTKDLLLQTQKSRALEVRPKSEALAGIPSLSYHAAYAGYNPASRVDSELQSMSSHSDLRAESDRDLTDVSSIDGSVHHLNYYRHKRSSKSSRSNDNSCGNKLRGLDVIVNRNSDLAGEVFIPRTFRSVQNKSLAPNELAKILTEKLEAVIRKRKEQEIKERSELELKDKLDKSLHQLMSTEELNTTNQASKIAPQQPSQRAFIDSTDLQSVESQAGGAIGLFQPKDLAAALREKFFLEDDNVQAILDEHVSRVFSETPNRSPGGSSPNVTRTKPITRKDYLQHHRGPGDLYSTFSTDSGNVHDYYTDNTSTMISTGGGGSTSQNMVKSKSTGANYLPDHYDQDPRFVRFSSNRRSSSKKTLAEFMDSGVSVLSSSSEIAPIKDNRILSWLIESGHQIVQTNMPNSPTGSRHRKGHNHSRSSSIDRGSNSSNPNIGRLSPSKIREQPAQPFVADPSMPPLPSPNTLNQLEEARRRLIDGDSSARTRLKDITAACSSSQSTLRRMLASGGGIGQPYTTAVISFGDEKFPYLLKIPGTLITLRQFKSYLPKKGLYRYFFKTCKAEVSNLVIQEEIVCDNDILPLWEGKIQARVKSVE